MRIPRALLPSPAAVLAAAVVSTFAPAVNAQQTSAPDGKDPGMVVARTVNPRIAYRGLPAAENPVHTRVTLFPLRAFGDVMEGTAGAALADEALGERGSAGLQVGAVVGSALTLGLEAHGLGAAAGSGAAAGPMGAGATVGASVGGAVRSGTAGLTRVLVPALTSGVTASGQGGGR